MKKYDFHKNESVIKWLIAILGLAVGIVSVIYTNLLVQKLAERERRQVDFFAKVQQQMVSMPLDNPDITFLLTEVLRANDLIPVILLDNDFEPISSRNIEVPEKLTEMERRDFLLNMVEDMKDAYPPIVIEITPEIHNYIYYSNSQLVNALRFAPVIQLLVLALLGIIAYMVFSSSKRAEQNQVWAGLAKETAHQLGTPISSLMAWIEYFKIDDDFDKDVITELEKDVSRLEMITARFSSIGSVPQLQAENVDTVVRNTVDYLTKRISSKVRISVYTQPRKNMETSLNISLFEWVIENLCKNAVDSMGNKGSIDIDLKEGKDEKSIVIDVTDTGKGIHKSKIKRVFKPGFTTKKRGWGLGLTLVKRIVEEYHSGRIYVKKSTPGVGTTFRIILPRVKE